MDSIISTIEASYADILLDESIELVYSKIIDEVWDTLKNEIPGMNAIEYASDGLSLLFNSDDTSANNMRILMQYTAGQYAEQSLIDAYSNYLSDPTEENAVNFNSTLNNYLAYQEYSSDWAKDFVNSISNESLLSKLLTDQDTVDTLLVQLNSDIDFSQRERDFISIYTDTYNKYTNNSSTTDSTENISDYATIYNGNSYKLFDIGMTWAEAESYCERLGGHLVTITSAQEEIIVEILLQSGTKNSYWLGAYKEDDSWLWIDNSIFEYSNWGSGQPDNHNGNENKIMIYKNTNPMNTNGKFGTWNDLKEDCTCGNESFFGTENFGFICEWDNEVISRQLGDLNGDGVIDAKDIKIINSSILKGESLTEEQFEYADMNGDNKINVLDVSILKRQIFEENS